MTPSEFFFFFSSLQYSFLVWVFRSLPRPVTDLLLGSLDVALPRSALIPSPNIACLGNTNTAGGARECGAGESDGSIWNWSFGMFLVFSIGPQ